MCGYAAQSGAAYVGCLHKAVAFELNAEHGQCTRRAAVYLY